MLSDQSLIYASHITTFCTAVDVYRPLYGVLENVINMASTRTGLEEQNVLSQLVACLVSMGYQVNQYIMDSWTYGSSQRRSRIILTIAAPGLEPILQREHTHSRSYEGTAARSLGKLPNGERFGDREHYATPFPFVSAQKATSDLPDIGNSNVQTCVPYPDHRLSRPTSHRNRALLECIPRHPPGCGYVEAMQLDLVPPSLRLTKKETGRAYRRIEADDLVPTITTDVNMQDARNGASVHWLQHRPLSILEARRTQGYPDHEPIVGTLSDQWKTVGNGVDRKVSFAIGLALRDAFSRSTRSSGSSQGLEDETERVVDVEYERIVQRCATSERSITKLHGEAYQSALASLFSDSFSPMRGRQWRGSSSLPLNGAVDTEPRPTSPVVFLCQRQDTVQQNLKSSETPLVLLSRTSTTHAEELSLHAQSTSRPVQSALPSKRRVEAADEIGADPFLATTFSNSVKRAKQVSEHRTPSPSLIKMESETESEHGRNPLPRSRSSTCTRTSRPAVFGPKEWHKKVGTSSNVLRLS